MPIISSADKSELPKFFLLIFVLSIPFWLVDVLTQLPKGIPINLPASSLMAFNPLIAALILTYRYKKSAGIKDLVKTVLDHKRIKRKRWYVLAILLMPAMLFLSYWVMYLVGLPLPPSNIPLLFVLMLFPVFFITAFGEEVGWLGYAIDPMQDRWGALYASMILGIVWVIWQFLGSIPLRILIVWVYNNTGKSILAGIVFHAMINVSEFSFPNYGSHYDPFISTIIFASAAAIVVFLWGPKTLTRYRCA